jgi:hypothetical protein
MSNLVETTRTLYAAFAAGDIPSVLGALAPDCAWTEAAGFPYGGTYVGPQAVLSGVFMRLGAEWDGFVCAPAEYFGQGDTVIVLGEYSGTYKATGKSFRAPLVHVWRYRDGLIVRFDQHTDTVLVQRALQPG